MSLPALADAESLKAWLGLASIDLDRADAVLDAASALVRAKAAQSYTDTVPDHVRSIVVQVAARMWENPAGLTSETAGAWTGRYSDVYITDDETSTLQARRATSGVWTLRTTRDDSDDTYYIDVEGSDKPLASGEPW